MTILKLKEGNKSSSQYVAKLSKGAPSLDDKEVSSFGHVCGKVSKASMEEELLFQVYQSLSRHGLKSHALNVSRDITKRLLQVWGGCQIYFPKPDILEVQEKYEKIYRDFTGKNHRTLAAKYHYSLPTIYRIIALMSKEYYQCDCLKRMIEDD